MFSPRSRNELSDLHQFFWWRLRSRWRPLTPTNSSHLWLRPRQRKRPRPPDEGEEEEFAPRRRLSLLPSFLVHSLAPSNLLTSTFAHPFHLQSTVFRRPCAPTLGRSIGGYRPQQIRRRAVGCQRQLRHVGFCREATKGGKRRLLTR